MSGTMWAQQLTGPQTFDYRKVPEPLAGDLRDGHIIVRMEAGGICGSDLPFYRGSAPDVPGFSAPLGEFPPGLPLHEIVGVVVAEKGTDLAEGARVVGWATGVDGLGELVVTRASSVIQIDRTLPAAQAVALQPLACVIHAVDRIPAPAAESVTILGVGPIGALFAHVLRTRGAGRIVGVDAVDRSDIATPFGLDQAIKNTARSWAIACRDDLGLRADLVIEAIGHQAGTVLDAVDSVAHGGTIFYFGIVDDDYLVVPVGELARRNATLMTGFTEEPARRGALGKALRYAEEHPDLLPAYVTHEIPLARAGDAFALALSPAPGQLKITVLPDSLTARKARS